MDLRERCIKALLELQSNEVVKLSYFNFVKLFSPLRTGAEGCSYIDSIVKVCQQDYFYGFISRVQAEAVLNEARIRIGQAVFLLRISSGSGAVRFCLSSIPTKAPPEHLVLDPTNYAKEGLLSYVESEVTKKKTEICKRIQL